MIKLVLLIFFYTATLFEVGTYLLIEFPDSGWTKLFFILYFFSIYFFFSNLIKGNRNGLKKSS